MPHPYLHGYELQPGQPAIDVSEALTASAAWASGGIVSTEADANTFIRGYLAPLFFSRHTQAAQLRFVPGGSGPPGPGTNAAGLAIFRYTTRCGTVYGHTGNGPGYTQLAATTPGGADSLAVTVTEQLNTRSNPELLAALRNAKPSPSATHWHPTSQPLPFSRRSDEVLAIAERAAGLISGR